MSENASTKTLALFITNNSLTYITKTTQELEEFYSEAIRLNLSDLNGHVKYEQIEKEVKANLPLLLYYDDVKICYLSTPTNIVPTEYLSENLNSYLNLTEVDKVKASAVKLNNVDAHLVYNNLSPISKLFQNLPNLKSATTTHTGKFLIDFSKIDAEKNQVFVRLIEQKLEICIYNQGVFNFYNVFDVASDEDIVYYILNTIEQLKLDANQISISLEGGITSDHLAYDLLLKYVNELTVNKEIEAIGPKYLLYKIFECE